MTVSSPAARNAMRRVTSCSVMMPASRPASSTISAEVALAALLRYLGVLDEPGRARLAGLAEPPIHNWAGDVTGAVRPAPGWPA